MGSAKAWGLAVCGFFAGGALGYLCRPSAMLIGQLPFSVVITRGATLEGLDTLLVGVAQKSFNSMVIGAIVGAVLLGVLGALLPTESKRPAQGEES